MAKQNIKTQAVLKKEGKNEFLYLKNVPVYFASILNLKKKYQAEEREYALTVFVDGDTREKLELPVDEDGVGINKEIKEVGKDRNKKKKIKFPLSKQLKDDKGVAYDDVEGMHGLQLSLNEYTKSGKKSILKVVDKDGKNWPKDKMVGNGSVVHVKCFGYRNVDEQLVVFPNLIVIVDHVPYEGASGGTFEDDELGITVDFSEEYENRGTDEKQSNDSDDDYDGGGSNEEPDFADDDDAY